MKQAVIALLIGLLVVPSSAGTAQETKKEKKTVIVHAAGWLGIGIRNVTTSDLEEKKLSSTDGVLVTDVQDESPADSADLKEGDVIVRYDGKQVKDPDDLRTMIRKTAPGTKVAVEVMRGGDAKKLSAVVGSAPGMKHRQEFGFQNFSHPQMPEMPRHFGFPKQFRFQFDHPRLGMNVEALNDQLGEYFGAPNNEGVLVKEVYKNSLAEKAGFKAGDVIIRIGTKSVDEPSDIFKAIRKSEDKQTLQVEVLRKGVKKTIPVTIEKKENRNEESELWDPSGEGDVIIRDLDGLNDIDVDVDCTIGEQVQKQMQELRQQLQHLDIPKRIRVHTNLEEI